MLGRVSEVESVMQRSEKPWPLTGSVPYSRAPPNWWFGIGYLSVAQRGLPACRQVEPIVGVLSLWYGVAARRENLSGGLSKTSPHFCQLLTRSGC